MEPTRLGQEPVTVDVARVEVGAGIQMARNDLGEVRLRPGQPLHVRFAYKVREASNERDEYQFVLASRLGKDRAEPSVAVWGDTWGVRDEVEGAIRNLFQPRAGTHDLEFHVTATSTRRPWRGEGATETQVEQATGTLRVVVG